MLPKYKSVEISSEWIFWMDQVFIHSEKEAGSEFHCCHLRCRRLLSPKARREGTPVTSHNRCVPESYTVDLSHRGSATGWCHRASQAI